MRRLVSSWVDKHTSIHSLLWTCLVNFVIDVLEASSIAWPNPGMWRQVPFASAYMSRPTGRQSSINLEAHSHSPRHKSNPPKPMLPPPAMNPAILPVTAQRARLTSSDPFYEPGEPRWRQQSSSTDVSMPDYSSHGSNASNSRHITDPVLLKRYEGLQSAGAFESICEALLLSAPTSTPTDGTPSIGQSSKKRSALDSMGMLNSIYIQVFHNKFFSNQYRSQNRK
jgi:hypothetical protein